MSCVSGLKSRGKGPLQHVKEMKRRFVSCFLVKKEVK